MKVLVLMKPRRMSGDREPRRRTALGSALGCLAGLGLVFAATVARAGVVRLSDLEAKAVEHRGTAAAAARRVAGARSEVDLSRAPYSPTAALNLDASGSPGGRLVGVKDSTGTEYQVAGSKPIGDSQALIPQARYSAVLGLQQRLYDFGRTRAGVAAAEAQVAAALAGVQATRETIVMEVRTAYLEWLTAAAFHETAELAVTNSLSRRQLVEARVATGTRPPSDLAPVFYELGLAELDEAETRGRARAAKLEVERAAAVPLDDDAVPDTALLDRDPPAGRRLEPEGSVVLEKHRQALLAEARLHERERSPIVTATVEAGVHGQDSSAFPAYRVGLSLNAPLLDGGVASAKAAASRAEAAAVEAQLREQRSAVTTERRRASSDLSCAIERIRIAELIRVAAVERASDAEDRYNRGTEGIEPVLEAATALVRASREVVIAKLARADAILRLYDDVSVEGAPPPTTQR